MKEYNFFKIDVPGKNGYSFLVGTKSSESTESIIDIAYDYGAFDNDEDYYLATAAKVEKDDYDYNHLKDTLIYLDAEANEMEQKIANASHKIVCKMIDAGLVESEPEGLSWEYEIGEIITNCLK